MGTTDAAKPHNHLQMRRQNLSVVNWPKHEKVDSFEMTDAGRDWGQEEKGMTEDEMAGWHHGLDGRESE